MDKKPIEIFTALDLEMNQPSKKIIQIGACVGNISTGQIFEKLSVFVNPQERISSYITNLTKITQEDVDCGFTLEEAYRKLQKMHENYGSFVNAITWGGGDSQELLDQLKEENTNFEGWCFGRRWIDTKTLFVSWRIANGQQIQGGLKNACHKIGVTFQGPAHRADMDALNTFFAFKKMLEIIKCQPN